MNAFSPTYVRRSVIVTPMERAPLAYFVVIVRLFRYGSLRCDVLLRLRSHDSIVILAESSILLSKIND